MIQEFSEGRSMNASLHTCTMFGRLFHFFVSLFGYRTSSHTSHRRNEKKQKKNQQTNKIKQRQDEQKSKRKKKSECTVNVKPTRRGKKLVDEKDWR